MRQRPTRGPATALLLGGLLVSACAPTTQLHGYMPSDADIAKIRPGVDTTVTVEEALGLPSGNGVLRDSAWYYVESRLENYTYHEPGVIDRRILAVHYTGDGVVRSVDRYGIQDGRIVNLSVETTGTGGREMGVLEQLFGNLLNLDASQFQDR